MLISTSKGTLNTRYIISVTASNRQEGYAVVKFVDGSELLITERDAGIIDDNCGTVVPAPPGFFVVIAHLPRTKDDDIVYDQAPVIAFRVAPSWYSTTPAPITFAGEPQHEAFVMWAVLQPDGTCQTQGLEHDSLDAFKLHCEAAAKVEG